MDFSLKLLQSVLLGVALSTPIGLALVLSAVVSWRRRLARYRLLDGIPGFQVRFANERRFRSSKKFFPWDGIGILSIRGSSLTLHAIPNKGEAFEITVDFGDMTDYGTRSWLKNGLIHWIRLGRLSGDVFVCPETGPTIFGSRRKYDEILKAIISERESVAHR